RAGRGYPARPSSGGEFHVPVAEVGHERRAATSEPEHLRVLVGFRLELARQLAAQREQRSVERIGLSRAELRPQERLELLRVGNLFTRERREVGELPPPALARRLRDGRIDEIGR